MIITTSAVDPQAILGESIRTNPDFVRDNFDYSSIGTPNTEIKMASTMALDGKQIAREMQALSLMRMMDFERIHVGFFQKSNDVHQENIDYYNSIQWTEADKVEIINRGLRPYVNNIFRRFALTMMGEQMARRTKWRAYGEITKNGVKAEFVNKVLNWVYDDNRWHLGEHHVFRDGMIGGRGVCSVGLDPADPFGRIKLQRCRPQEFMWDIASATDGRLSNTQAMWRGYYVPRKQMIKEFPEWEEELKSGLIGDIRTTWSTMLENFMRPKIQDRMGGLGLDFQYSPFDQMPWREYVSRREFYYVDPQLRYKVVDAYSRMSYYFELPEQAAEFTQAQAQYYNALFASVGKPQDRIAVSEPIQEYVDRIYQTVWAGDTLLRVTEGNSYPYQHFIPEYYDGEITSFFQHGKDQQRIMNRAMIRMDQAAGNVKSKIVLNRAILEQDLTYEDLMENLKSDTEPLLVSVPPGKPISEIAGVIPQSPMNEVVNMLYRLTQDAQFLMFGGENSIGSQETSQESGKAVMARRAAASLATIPHFEEFSAWKKNVGEQVLYDSQFLDPVVQAMVADIASNPQFEAILNDGVQTIRDERFLVDIEETSASPTEKDMRLQRLLLLASQNPALAPYVLDVALKYSDVDDSDIQTVMARVEQDKQAAAKAQQEQVEFERNIKLDEMRLKQITAVTKLKDVQIRENNPGRMNYNFMFKGEEMPSGLLASVLNREGIPADPVGVAADRALRTAMDLEVLRKETEIESENKPEENREPSS